MSKPDSRTWNVCTPCYSKYLQEYRLQAQYGLSPADYEQMLEDQNYRCFLCGKKAKLVVDHDHSSGETRSLLCYKCNSGLGAFDDSPDLLHEAVEYLRLHR